MPAHLVCPSCSAALSVKDEYAGRAVRCPQCGGVIAPGRPGSAPPALPNPAVPAPHPLEPETVAPPLEAAAEPAAPGGALPVARPVAKRGEEPADGGGGARPAPRHESDEDRGSRGPRRGARGGAAGGDDRPPRRPRRRYEDDGHEDEERNEKKGVSATTLILGILGAVLLTCCGTAGYAGWWAYTRVQKAKDDFVEALDKLNLRVNAFTYADLKVGEATRAVADSELGDGRVATDDDLAKVFATSPERIGAWSQKVSQKRAIVWQSGDDYLIAAFHPTADGTARLQAKEWRPGAGAALSDGELDDAKFLQRYPLQTGDGPKPAPPGAVLEVTDEQLVQAFQADARAADAKYKNRVLIVNGTIVSTVPLNKVVSVTMTGFVTGTVKKELAERLEGASRGQAVRLKGTCVGLVGTVVLLADCEVLDVAPGTVLSVRAADLIAEVGKDPEAAEEKYSGKTVRVRSARVVDVDEGQISLTGADVKGAKVRLRVSYQKAEQDQFAALKIGDTVNVQGECTSCTRNEITIDFATVVP